MSNTMQNHYNYGIPMAPAVEIDDNDSPAPPQAPYYPNASMPQQQQQQQPQQFTATPRINDVQMARLMEQGYTRGLIRSLEDSNRDFALKIWIVDNSGSMQQADGHRIVGSKNHPRMIPCTRWEEIQECINYHIQLAEAIQSTTNFRLLNHPGAIAGTQRFTVGQLSMFQQQLSSPIVPAQEAQRIMSKVRPGGCTPLTMHLFEIHHQVSQMLPTLRQTGQRVAIIIATDGLPTDDRGYGGKHLQDEFIQTLRLLEGLPVWVVIRLCTDDESVVDFYNTLDQNLELSIEVLDDFVGEAQEVYEANPWLNYSLLLHRLREMGYHDRVFDILDERLLTKSELRDFCMLLFGEEKFDGISDPTIEWDRFVHDIERLCRGEEKQWDPITRTMKPWIDIRALNRAYGEASCICM